jgi:hypothetical protein
MKKWISATRHANVEQDLVIICPVPNEFTAPETTNNIRVLIVRC